MMITTALQLLGLSLCMLTASVTSELLKSVSFSKPFDTISADGDRQVGPDWTIGGTTVVNRHFARLTPDRQSKRGHIWSKEKIGRKEFSLILTFRISGQAKDWYGDGLALWITTAQQHIPGDNHGFTGTYTGLGFVFDTFVNTEHSGGHKDVTVFENDGTKTLDQLNDATKVGCMAPSIRYHEKNAAFSPSLNMSRAKIQYKEGVVMVSVDSGNKGEWDDCYVGQTKLPAEWAMGATVGITASTGGLADNHDVISLSVYDDLADMDHAIKDEKVKKDTIHDLDEGLSKGDNASKLRLIKRKYEQLIEDFEHQFTALKESTQNTIAKLREQEAEDAKMIAKLEAWANGEVNERVTNTVDAIREQVDEKLVETVKQTAEKTSGWKTPFFLLILVLGGIVAAGYKKYQDLRKSHLL